MICAVCKETLIDDGPTGWTHEDRSLIAEDGHAVCPVTRTFERE